MKKLAICIPTYNRRAYLREAIESIPVHFRDSLEICVSDNASTDGTDQMIAELQEIFPDLKYFRWGKNQGADRNYQKCVELATAEFAFILGSDDRIASGSLELILPQLNADKAAIFVLPRREFFVNRPGQESVLHRWGRMQTNRSYDFRNDVDLDEYLDSSDYLGALFSYLSSFIFNRASWMSFPYDERFHGTLYTHVAQVLKIALAGGKLHYLDIPLAVTRIGNDGFANSKSIILRSEIDVVGYMKIHELLLAPRSAQTFRKMIKSELQRVYFNSAAKLIYIKGRSLDSDWVRFMNFVKKNDLLVPLLRQEKNFPFWFCRLAAKFYVQLRKLQSKFR